MGAVRIPLPARLSSPHQRRVWPRAARLAGALAFLALGCGRSAGDAVDTKATAGGVGGTGGHGGAAAAVGGAAGLAAAAVGGGSSAGGTGGDTGASGARGGAGAGGGAGTLGDAASGGAGAGRSGAAGSITGGGLGGDSAEGGAAGAEGDPDVPGHDDLIVRSSHMSMYEGMTVYATFDHNFGELSRSAPRSDIIVDGGFELEWIEGFDRDSFGAYVVLFVDRAGDGACTADDDPAWSSFANNLSEPGTPEIAEFDPSEEGLYATPITCEEFNTWFGENFPGI